MNIKFREDLHLAIYGKADRKAVEGKVLSSKKQSKACSVPYNLSKKVYACDFELIIGERVVQKTYAFPMAFVSGMKLENGEEVPVTIK